MGFLNTRMCYFSSESLKRIFRIPQFFIFEIFVIKFTFQGGGGGGQWQFDKSSPFELIFFDTLPLYDFNNTTTQSFTHMM